VLLAYKETSMGSDAVLVALIGLAGIVIGVIAMILISRRQATRKPDPSKQTEKTEIETISILGEDVDIRELRILRALFGEPKGRRLGSFKDMYYRPSLDATIEKGWVKQAGSRYVMTPKGGNFCRTYLQQVLNEWKVNEA
jgi:coproporphyrinogen III oxidase-like Fe-S oxidoreductase